MTWPDLTRLGKYYQESTRFWNIYQNLTWFGRNWRDVARSDRIWQDGATGQDPTRLPKIGPDPLGLTGFGKIRKDLARLVKNLNNAYNAYCRCAPKSQRRENIAKWLTLGGLSRVRDLVHPLQNWFKNATTRDLGTARTFTHISPRYLPRGSPPYGVMGALWPSPVSQRRFRRNSAGETSKNGRGQDNPFGHDKGHIAALL